VTNYLWREAQGSRVQTQDDHDDFTAGLYILGSIVKGWSMPVLVAYYYAFGVPSIQVQALQVGTSRTHGMGTVETDTGGDEAQDRPHNSCTADSPEKTSALSQAGEELRHRT
jgi:hypothetical protein